ncbi:hypothetical protein [Micromonospora sp. M71_S20]|uniref:hypothetical protein n=1 Tax=Micromonospora sp. M71_S20 TaxID=592872 RepID=UPI0013155BFE|nr:hypothetical protein [Micromonospora sp. M71_S20]
MVRQPVKHGDCDGIELALPRPHEPALNDSEVAPGQPATWIDPMQQGRTVVMSEFSGLLKQLL